MRKVKAEIDEAEKLAIQDCEPDVATLFEDVYVRGSEPTHIRGRTLEETRTF